MLRDSTATEKRESLTLCEIWGSHGWRWLWRLSSGAWRSVAWQKITVVPEKYVASIFEYSSTPKSGAAVSPRNTAEFVPDIMEYFLTTILIRVVIPPVTENNHNKNHATCLGFNNAWDYNVYFIPTFIHLSIVTANYSRYSPDLITKLGIKIWHTHTHTFTLNCHKQHAVKTIHKHTHLETDDVCGVMSDLV